MKYLIITDDDAKRIAVALADSADPELHRVAERFRHDTGGDIQAVVDALKNTPVCGPCSIEGQASRCQSIGTRAYGRRLGRLLARAQSAMMPGATSVGEGTAPERAG